MTTEQKIIPEGYEARYEHHRRVVLFAEAQPKTSQGPVLLATDVLLLRSWEWHQADAEGYGIDVLPTGGWTVCKLYKQGSEEMVAQGVTRCSISDNYEKSKGRVKALGNAIAAMNSDDPFRKPVA